MVIWVLKLTVLLGEKNFVKKTLVRSFHIMMHLEGKEYNHALALSLREKGNSRTRITWVKTPLSFNVSHTSKNAERCKLGSSSRVPPNRDCCTMEIRDGMSSKL